MNPTMSRSHLDRYKLWLSSDDPNLRLTAVAVMSHAGIRETSIDLKMIELLETDDDVEIRREIVRTISERKDPKFVNVLVKILGDSDYIVRGRAFISLKALDGCWNSDHEILVAIQTYVENETHPFGRWCIGEN